MCHPRVVDYHKMEGTHKDWVQLPASQSTTQKWNYFWEHCPNTSWTLAAQSHDHCPGEPFHAHHPPVQNHFPLSSTNRFYCAQVSSYFPKFRRTLYQILYKTMWSVYQTDLTLCKALPLSLKIALQRGKLRSGRNFHPAVQWNTACEFWSKLDTHLGLLDYQIPLQAFYGTRFLCTYRWQRSIRMNFWIENSPQPIESSIQAKQLPLSRVILISTYFSIFCIKILCLLFPQLHLRAKFQFISTRSLKRKCNLPKLEAAETILKISLKDPQIFSSLLKVIQ